MRSNDSSNASSYGLRDNWATNPTWTVLLTNPFEGFAYDYESIAPGFCPSTITEAYIETPQPMADSLPNPRNLGYYPGTKTS